MPLVLMLLAICAIAAPTLSQATESTSQASICHPGSNWVLTRGSPQPDIESQAQQVLNQAGIAVKVDARSFGETDSCGKFVPTAIDFTLTLINQRSLSIEGQKHLTDEIYSILTPLGKPNLGNVKLRLAPSSTLSLNDTFLSLTPPVTQAATTNNLLATPGQLAFISLSGNNSLSVLNTQDNTIIKSGISVGNSPVHNAFSPDGGRIYVANDAGNSVSVVDTATYQGIATISVGSGPRGIAVSKDGSRVYVSNNGSKTLSIIDTGSLTLVKTIPLTAHPEEIALSPDGHRLFIAATVPFIGFILDTATETLIGSFDSSAGNGMAITPDGTHAYISNWNNTVTVVDLATMLVVKTIPVGTFPHRVTISPNSQYAYVANLNSNNVSVINIETNTVVATIPVGSSPWAMDVLDDNSRLYVPTGAGSIAVVDTGTNSVVQQIPMGAAASSITLLHTSPNALHKKVYVIVYDPLLSNGQNLSTYLSWNSYITLNLGTISLFKQASNNYLWYDVVDTTVVTSGWPVLDDGFQYTEATYLAVMANTIQPPSTAMVNYNAIVNSPQFDICGKANRGEIDEVWIFNGPNFGFYESTLVGPDAYWFNSSPVPGPHTCNRLVPIMGPSPERGVAEEVHNFGHRTESTMMKIYGSGEQNSTANSWEKFALVKSLSPNYSYSGCGNTHFPPNGTSDYNYNNQSTVMSSCNDFANYPNLHDPTTILQPVTCSLWNCDHIGYMGYLFSHIPSSGGCGPDNVANNWWKYIANPNLALNPSSICQTAAVALSINFTTGQPGSYFTLTGTNYPPNSVATLTINGNNLGTTTTDTAGSLIFVLSTSAADVGTYRVTVTTIQGSNITINSSLATSTFELTSTAPLRPQINTGTVVTVPSGISALQHTVFLPTVMK